jgi:hypothetical protein
MKNLNWFAVDKDGLAKQLAGQNGGRLAAELVQNAWDEAVTRVEVTVAARPGGGVVLTVEDDNPTGFSDLAAAWTLFKPSTKASQPDLRGRYNFGEKLVFACATDAKIETTTGAVRFDAAGRHLSRRPSRTVGSCVQVGVPAGRGWRVADVVDRLRALIPPPNVTTTINGVSLQAPVPLRVLSVVLPTIIADTQGTFRQTRRETTVHVYRPSDIRPPAVCELGIPVVEADLPFIVDVLQKVPLNRDRDNVPPAFLKPLRMAVFNATADLLDDDAFRAPWAREAAGDPAARAEAVARSLDARFGERRVAFDPSDPEANRLAVAQGYTVVHGGSLSADEWSRARATTRPAGKVTPSPRPEGPDGEPLHLLDREKATKSIQRVAQFARDLGAVIGIKIINVQLADDPAWPFRATFGPSGTLTLNVPALGAAFFQEFPRKIQPVVDLLIHEFGHFDGSNHFEERYWTNLSDVGARVVDAALKNPRLFAGTAGDR